MDTLKLREVTFSAAHYLPEHPKCCVIHGHTYFVRHLLIDCEAFVDLGAIKATIMDLDHTMIIPAEHESFWASKQPAFEKLGIKLHLTPTEGPPTVENIKKLLKKKLSRIPGVLRVRFELFEGPNQGVTDYA